MKNYHCERCGHEWYPRKPRRPRQCPKCKSVLWDTPKQEVVK